MDLFIAAIEHTKQETFKNDIKVREEIVQVKVDGDRKN